MKPLRLAVYALVAVVAFARGGVLVLYAFFDEARIRRKSASGCSPRPSAS